MSSVSILHMRTGERPAAAIVDEWLAHHELAVLRCEDALDAAVLMLTRPEAMPDLALVGLAWLEPDELVVLDYLRETWPHVAIVTYGPGDPPPHSGIVLHCASAAALRQALAAGPVELCNRLAADGLAAPPAARRAQARENPGAPSDLDDDAAAGADPQQAEPRPGNPRSAAVPLAPLPARPEADGEDAGQPQRMRDDPAAVHDAGLGRIALERPMLTAAELAALLDEPLRQSEPRP